MTRSTSFNHIKNIIIPVSLLLALPACAQSIKDMEVKKGDAVKQSNGQNPYIQFHDCFTKNALPADADKITWTVQNIEDLTGKFNVDRGSGRWITQGGTDIMYSALYVPGRTNIVERSRTGVLEWEVKMANKKLLGDRTEDGQKITRKIRVQGENGPKIVQVGYRGLPQGMIRGSDVYVVGSINRLDLNTNSAAINARIAGIGPEAEAFAMQVGGNFRVINTRNSKVVADASLYKEIVGEKYGVGAGRIFGDTTVELGAEVKRNEPVHVALQSMLYLAAVELQAQVYDVNVPENCYAELKQIDGVRDYKDNNAPKTGDIRSGVNRVTMSEMSEGHSKEQDDNRFLKDET